MEKTTYSPPPPVTPSVVSSPPPTLSAPALDSHDSNASLRTLFRHSLRESWGMAIVLRKLDDRVRMQFEDGRMRTFKRDYYHLIHAVDRPLDVTNSIVEALESMTDEGRAPVSASRESAFSPDEQLALLRELYPGGFRGEAYTAQHRGDGRKRPLKRHRDALVKGVAPLSKGRLLRRLSAGSYAGVHAALTKLVDGTDLVAPKERKRFAAVDEVHFGPLAISLHTLLHGTSELAVRFDAFVRVLEEAMGTTPSWSLATIALGTVHANTHVVVRKNVLTRQAEWMAPGLSISDRPMGILYERLVEMCGRVKEHLEAAGQTPRDMLDVVDFMSTTLRPKSRERMLELRRQRRLTGEPVVSTSVDREAA